KQPVAVLAGAAALLLIVVVGGGIYFAGGKKSDPAQPADAAAVTPAPVVAAPAVVSTTPVAASSEPGMLTISAVGYADPGKFNGDAAAAGVEARADAKRQLIEKALALYVSHDSLNRNYQWVQDKFLPRSAEFIKATLAEEAPQLGKDGLVALTTRATIRVKDVQKSLNQMSDKERVDFIRNNGDPKIAV